MWHGVTLASTFAEAGDRHPKVRRGATLAAHAIILGNIEVGEGAVIAAAGVLRASRAAALVGEGRPVAVSDVRSRGCAATAAPSAFQNEAVPQNPTDPQQLG